MSEYETLGHMTRVLHPTGNPDLEYHFPHHAVMRFSNTTTQLRVVFNASAVTKTGQTLNDCLLVGPKLQTDLSAVILQWRQCRIVLPANIAKMYRQCILIYPQDVIDYLLPSN